MSTTEEQITSQMNQADDEMPAPPTADASAEAAPVDGGFDEKLMSQVEKLGEPFPAGTFSFRSESYEAGWGDEKTNKRHEKIAKFGNQPYYQTRWVCTSEPHVGKNFFLRVMWINAETFKLAQMGDSEALGLVRKRLMTAKTLMAGLEYKGNDFSKFLDSKPEGKFTLSVAERKTYVGDKLTATGEMMNNLVKVLPLYKQG